MNAFRTAALYSLYHCILNLFAVSCRAISCINHARVPYARLLNSYRYLSSSRSALFQYSILVVFIARTLANSQRVQTPSIITRLDPFLPLCFFSFTSFSISFLPFSFFCLPSARDLFRTPEMVDVRTVNKCVRCFLFFFFFNYDILCFFPGEEICTRGLIDASISFISYLDFY